VLGAVNNETGVKTDIHAIASIAKQANVPLIVDGVALLGKEPFEIPQGVSAMAFSGHKLHGPKGSGLALIRSSLSLYPLLTGGDQETGRRAGTENLPAIIGFAKAIQLLDEELPEATTRMHMLRQRLEEGLQQAIGPLVINGQGPRICNTSNISFPGVEGETLLIALDMAGIAVSHGSACASGALEPSRILQNMGISKTLSRSSVRFSLSRWTTSEEIDACIEITSSIVKKLK
jgi:cysteine desulfurase